METRVYLYLNEIIKSSMLVRQNSLIIYLQFYCYRLAILVIVMSSDMWYRGKYTGWFKFYLHN